MVSPEFDTALLLSHLLTVEMEALEPFLLLGDDSTDLEDLAKMAPFSTVTGTLETPKEIINKSTDLEEDKPFIDVNGHFVFSPNPTTGFIYLEVPTGMDLSDIKTTVYNFTGQLLKVPIVSVSNSRLAFDMSGFENGNYVVKIVTDSKTVVYKSTLKR